VAKLNLPEGRGYCGVPHRRFVPTVAGSPYLGYARVALEMAGRTPIISGQLVM